MYREEINNLHLERNLRKAGIRFKCALRYYTSDITHILLTMSAIAAMIIAWKFRVHFYPHWYVHDFTGSPVFVSELIFDPLLSLLFLGMIIGSIAFESHTQLSFKLERAFRRVGLINRAGEPPFIKDVAPSPQYSESLIITFDSTGIPLSTWKNKSDEVEAAMNMFIISINRGRTLQEVIIHAKEFLYSESTAYQWNDNYISHRDFELAIGESFIGIETANLNVVSHMLIAGSTGSGKTVMLKSLLYQCLKKGADVRLVDFKGGANFSRIWKKHIDIVKNEARLSELLTEIIGEMERRKLLFDANDCEDITQYNNRCGRMPRIIVAFDEVAQCFDKTGLSSNDKKKVQELEHQLSAIARLGRAFGIHLILGLQRPDANVITGQIKSNIDLRMCGRCDDTLSMIVLDNTDASREIGEEDQGKFMLSSGRLIQGFFFKDSDVKL